MTSLTNTPTTRRAFRESFILDPNFHLLGHETTTKKYELMITFWELARLPSFFHYLSSYLLAHRRTLDNDATPPSTRLVRLKKRNSPLGRVTLKHDGTGRFTLLGCVIFSCFCSG